MKRGFQVNTLMPKLERGIAVDSPSLSEQCSADAET
jgi:hypothetical protein